MLGSIFFGFFASLQTIFQGMLPSQLVMTAPYLFTLLVITFGLRKSAAPAGVGKYHNS
jgi:simple sugar transport system permease protein